jgi:AmmeMemoRadiSam system protein A
MFELPEEDRQLLLRIARNAVKAHLSESSFHLPEILQGVAAEPHGVFVSLHHGNKLRGCIGNVAPSQPLYRTTARCAVAAATEDPRFSAVTLEELPLISFELSVLGMPEPVRDVEAIEIGKHGLIISKGSARGLLLPQVAVEYGWNRNQFLAETCIKAGVHPNSWREGATIHSFTADVFRDEHIHQPDPSRQPATS